MKRVKLMLILIDQQPLSRILERFLWLVSKLCLRKQINHSVSKLLNLIYIFVVSKSRKLCREACVSFTTWWVARIISLLGEWFTTKCVSIFWKARLYVTYWMMFIVNKTNLSYRNGSSLLPPAPPYT